MLAPLHVFLFAALASSPAFCTNLNDSDVGWMELYDNMLGSPGAVNEVGELLLTYHSSSADLLPSLQPGDILFHERKFSTPWPIYQHASIYVGTENGVPMVVEYNVDEVGDKVRKILKRPLAAVAKNDRIAVANAIFEIKFAPLDRAEIVASANAAVGAGAGQYSLLGNNCLHFVRKMRYGVGKNTYAQIVATTVLEFATTSAMLAIDTSASTPDRECCARLCQTACPGACRQCGYSQYSCSNFCASYNCRSLCAQLDSVCESKCDEGCIVSTALRRRNC